MGKLGRSYTKSRRLDRRLSQEDSYPPLLGDCAVFEVPELTRPADWSYGIVDAADISRLFDAHPEPLTKFLEGQGVQELGTMSFKGQLPDDLQTAGCVMTFGSDRWDIDWREEWKQRLRATQTAESGSKPVETVLEASVVRIRHAAGNVSRPEGSDHPEDVGLLSPLLGAFQEGSTDWTVFSYPATQAVINYKWNTWAKRFLNMEFACYMVWLLSYQVFVLVEQDEKLWMSLSQLLATPLGWVMVISELLALVGMMPFVYIEFRTVREWGFKGWLNVWNVMDIMSYAFQVLITVQHLTRWHLDSNELSILLAVQNLLLWIKVQYYFRVSEASKIPFIDTMQQVIMDVKSFILLLIMAMWGFAGAFYILLRKDQNIEEFETVPHSMITTLMFMLGGADPKLFYHSHVPVAGICLLLFYILTMALIFLNCLMAITIDSWAKVQKNQGLMILSAKAQLIDELEKTIPVSYKDAHPTWYPSFIHVLRMRDPSSDALGLHAAWTQCAKGGSAACKMALDSCGANGQDDGSGTSLHDLAAHAQAVTRRLDAQQAVLERQEEALNRQAAMLQALLEERGIELD